MARKPKPPPDNADGLWRSYYGSGQIHRYDAAQLNAAWHHQVALCGRETRTATGNFSPLRGKPHAPVCGKCRRIVETQTEKSDGKSSRAGGTRPAD